MKKEHDKSNIINSIHHVAKLYQSRLVGKTFLILYEGNSSEILFKSDNFLHLCGVGTNLSAKYFYKYAINKKLSSKDIFFNTNHPYDFASTKTQHLHKAVSLLNRDSFVITDVSTQTKTFKLGATDLEVVFCFDSQVDNTGNVINNVLVPYSLRVEDIPNNKFNNMYEVDYVLSKKTGTKNYINIEYGNPNLLASYLEKHSITDYSININNSESTSK